MAELIQNDGSDPSALSAVRKRMAERWLPIDSLMGGTRGMREAGKQLLPQRAKEPEMAYRARLRSSFLFNAFRDAVKAIVAKPFSQDVSVKGELPIELEPLLKNCDGHGTSLDSFLSVVFRTGWAYGGAHVLVEFPKREAIKQRIEQGLSLDEVTPENNRAVELFGGMRPYFAHVHPHDLLGVTYRRNGANIEIVQARIRECTVEKLGEFGEQAVERVRVIEPNQWRVYTKTREGWMVTDKGPSTLGFVPLLTYYTNEIAPFEYEPPLEDLADLNVCHWQSSSLQRNSLDIARIPMLVQLGNFNDSLDETESDGKSKQAIIGTSSFFSSRDTDADVFYAEHSGAALGAGAEDLKNLRDEMEVLSMMPWLQRAGDTATGVAANEGKGECQVQTMARRLEPFALSLFEAAAKWAKTKLPEDLAFDIFDEFGISPTRSQDVLALIQMRREKMISHETFLLEAKKLAALSEDVDPAVEIARTDEEKQSMASIFGSGFSFGGDGFGSNPAAAGGAGGAAGGSSAGGGSGIGSSFGAAASAGNA